MLTWIVDDAQDQGKFYTGGDTQSFAKANSIDSTKFWASVVTPIHAPHGALRHPQPDIPSMERKLLCIAPTIESAAGGGTGHLTSRNYLRRAASCKPFILIDSRFGSGNSR